MLNGYKCDVKTKRCTSKPKEYYECSVAKYNTRQDCDYYVFVRVLEKGGIYSKGWILGCYPQKEYTKDSRALKKGQKDGDNGFIVRADCYNMSISKLHDMECLNK